MKYLIVNADDFGYSYSVNRGIIEAHTKGIVTSTSVMIDALAAHEAASLAAHPDLSVGLHFVVEDMNHVGSELQRQIERFMLIVGSLPDHIDTHKKHTSDPGIKEVLTEYAAQHAIPLRSLSGVPVIESFFGLHSGGDVSIEQLKKALDEAVNEYSELMCHVGYSDDYLRGHSSYNDPREKELESVCSSEVKSYLQEKNLKLCNWKRIKI